MSVSAPFRIAYTQYHRHQTHKESAAHPLAVNAIAMSQEQLASMSQPDIRVTNSDEFTGCKAFENDEKAMIEHARETRSVSSASSSSSDSESAVITSSSRVQPVAVLPQYITPITTKITVSELSLPHLSSSFKVLTPDNKEILSIHRERPSLSGRQIITDALTSVPLLTVRRLKGQVPPSYAIEDPSENRILEIEGNFFLPFSGAKSSVTFSNAVDGSKVKLFMHGSWHNKRATIKNEETNEIIASMSSEVFNLKNLVGRRRTYTVTVAGGVDVALVVTMIAALDARAD